MWRCTVLRLLPRWRRCAAGCPWTEAMIDFVSTRAGACQQTAACARLLAAVIAHAIGDACKKPTKAEKDNPRLVDFDARKAIDFLFGPDSVFPLYADLIGSNAEAIRGALLDDGRGSINSIGRSFGAMERRVLSARIRRRAALAH